MAQDSKMIKDRRLELHEELCEILGSRNVYFQPPESIKMKYPAIRYERMSVAHWHADNNPYLRAVQYRVYVIDRNPDSEIIDKMAEMPKCRYERRYVSDNLNHDVFVLYY